jgi:hypothetical protein
VMTNRNLIIGAVIIILLAIAANTAVVLWVGNAHHSQTASKISQLERDIRTMGRERK